MPDVRELVTPVPPMDEQITIARWTVENAAYLDRLIAKVRDSMSCLRKYRTALISAAVTRKIDVRQEGGDGF
jgi:type I restriction enzyme S subunit